MKNICKWLLLSLRTRNIAFWQAFKGLETGIGNYEKLRGKTTFDFKLGARLSASKFQVTKLDHLKSIVLPASKFQVTKLDDLKSIVLKL